MKQYHSETIHDVKMATGLIASTGYSVLDYSFNAGNSSLFPRLASMADLYQMWRAVKWHIRWVPIASMFGNNKSGVVCLSQIKNWYDAVPDSMTAQTERGRRSRVKDIWEGFTLDMLPTSWKYVRDSFGSGGKDMRLNDEIIEVGLEGCDAAATGAIVGYIYVSAVVEFKDPYTVSILNAPRTNSIQIFGGGTHGNSSTYPTLPGGVTSNLSFPAAGTQGLANSGFTGVSKTTTTQFQFAGGTYRLSVRFNAACAGVATMSTSVTTSAGQIIQQDGGANALDGPVVNLTSAANYYPMAYDGVLVVPEGSIATVAILFNGVQAAATAITIYNPIFIVEPC